MSATTAPERYEAGVRQRLHPLHAFEHALAGADVRVIDQDGRRRPLPTAQWLAPADAQDHRLLLEQCHGPTIDLGCGPGRLLVGLAERAVTALGVDASPVAVAHARRNGVRAIRRDLFGTLPGTGRWQHALLADGNIGIGGDPVRLLNHVGSLVRPGGTVLVEVGPPGTGVRHERLRLDVDGALSVPFRWSLLGVDAVGSVARTVGLRLGRVRHAEWRHVAELHRSAG